MKPPFSLKSFFIRTAVVASFVLAVIVYLVAYYLGFWKTSVSFGLYVGALIIGLTLLAMWAGTRPTKSLCGMLLITSVLCMISAIQPPHQVVAALSALVVVSGTLTQWASRMNSVR